MHPKIPDRECPISVEVVSAEAIAVTNVAMIDRQLWTFRVCLLRNTAGSGGEERVWWTGPSSKNFSKWEGATKICKRVEP